MKETIIHVLQEEIQKRTNIKIQPLDGWNRQVTLALSLSSDAELSGKPVPSSVRKVYEKDGFTCLFENEEGKQTLWLVAADGRGALFAGGYFLRTARMSRGKIIYDTANDTATSPEYELRGHQLGYRNTANSYDAWSVAQYEQYIRDLAIFGTNCIEQIPFDTPSSLMKKPILEMDKEISLICQRYGLDFWVWIPVKVDLTDNEVFRKEVQKHHDYYKNCPKLDNVFIPGGDPGNNHPREVMLFLKEIAVLLQTYHPGAGIWLSLQGFSDEQSDYFYNYLETESPDWFTGAVSGPGSPEMSDMRYRLPKKYKHRHYPDITHTVRCQYPTPQWDQAYALTLGREPINPEPFHYAKIHNTCAPLTDGFITYSDGVHDDINKIVWSCLGWDSEQEVNAIIEQYVQYFFGTKTEDKVAEAIFALERNWRGPLEENGGIESTFYKWQQLERSYPGLQTNWRWQMLVLRAYYDTYITRRKLYEQRLEKEAGQILAEAEKDGIEQTLQKALAKVNQADTYNPDAALRQKIAEYCEMLFQSTGLQTSVEKYQAGGPERGCILDFVDYPLNNRWWLADEFDKIRRMTSREEQLARIDIIRTWENPGKGSFYDNISNIGRSPHVLTTVSDARDVAWWDKGMSRKRMSTQLFQNFPKLVYENLDPQGRYIIRISGYGDALLRVEGKRISPTLYNKALEEFKEFLIDRKYVSDGRLEITFDEPEESHLNWRQYSKICDIWLIKTK
ncbi:MAG: hypothetical protein LBP25_00875 [Tannerellaceae bacterium]|nr:hypothetical protein [Tannerellaceae bacterium]